MTSLSSDILLALAYVSQISDPEMLRSRFMESLNEIAEAFSFESREDPPPGTPERLVFPIATNRSSFGYAVMKERSAISGADRASLRNAFRLLAIIIENRMQESQLESRNKSLLMEIRQEKSLARTILDTLPVGVWVTDEKGQILMGNAAGERIWAGTRYVGIDRYEEYKAWWPETGEVVGKEEWALVRALRTGKTILGEEMEIEGFDGSRKTILNSASPILEGERGVVGAVSVNQEITERKRGEELVKKSLAEKEILLRELYHRTKNNMAVITALLSMQAEGSGDARLKGAFASAIDRIQSMALVHKKLYEAKDLSSINLKAYIEDLVSLLLKSYSVATGALTLVSDMDEVLVLIDTAIPCGLILNELISNALKYAFPEHRGAEIRIGLHRGEDGAIELAFSDNGRGAPEGFSFRRDGHLGIWNVYALGEQQLQGRVDFDSASGKGVSCRLRFIDEFYRPRV
jgi:PAS domain S-box-containing protein